MTLGAAFRSGRLRLWMGITIVTASILLLRAHFLFAVTVGQSMLPTLKHHEFLLVSRTACRETDPQRGDIVLARVGRELLVKRVVGLPGEEIAVCRGVLLIGRQPCPESYVQAGPLTVPEAKLRADQFALLGDNRALPEGMAMHGIAPKKAILGKVIFSVRLQLSMRHAVVLQGHTSARDSAARGKPEQIAMQEMSGNSHQTFSIGKRTFERLSGRTLGR